MGVLSYSVCMAEPGTVLIKLVLGTWAAMAGAARGRVYSPRAAPRRTLRRRVGARLLVQLLGVCGFACAATGAFYLNGSYTHTDFDSGAQAYLYTYTMIWVRSSHIQPQP